MLDGSWVAQGSWSGWGTREEKMVVSWSWQRMTEHWGAWSVALQISTIIGDGEWLANDERLPPMLGLTRLCAGVSE